MTQTKTDVREIVGTGKVEHFLSFTFAPIDFRLIRDLLDKAKRLPFHERVEFESSAVRDPGFESPEPVLGVLLKAKSRHSPYKYPTTLFGSQVGLFFGSSIAGTDVPIDVELEKYLRSLTGLRSPRERHFRNAALDLVDSIRRLDQTIAAIHASNPSPEPLRDGVAGVCAYDPLVHVNIYDEFIKRQRPDFHSDGHSGYKHVISNIPTRYRDFTRYHQGRNEGNFDVEPEIRVPRPFDVASFDTAKTDHGPPEIRNRKRQFIALSHRRSGLCR